MDASPTQVIKQPHDAFLRFVSMPSLEQGMLEPERIDAKSLLYAVQKYLSGIPHMADAAKVQVTLGECREFYFYNVEAAALVEMRKVERMNVPYRGWKFPPKSKDESNIDAWAYALPPQTFGDPLEPKKSIVSDSQSLHECANCQATGVLKCTSCNATGRVTCRGCDGQAQVACFECGGSGTIKKTRAVQRSEKCKNCGLNAVMNVIAVLDSNPFSHARRCSTCGGTGVRRWTETEEATFKCKQCRNTGKVRCGTCDGAREVPCAQCSGKGNVGCPKCEKCKRIISYLALTQEHKVVAETLVAFPGVFKDWLKYIDQDQFRSEASNVVFDDITRCANLELFTAAARGRPFAGELAKTVCSLVNTARGRVRKNGRVVQERICISRGRCIAFQYSHLGQRYTALSKALTGDAGHAVSVLPHVSPATSWMCEQLRVVKELSDAGDSRGSALLLRQCKDVANGDPVCRQYLQEGVLSIPDNVLEMSKNVRFNAMQIVLMISAAATLILGGALSALVRDTIPIAGGLAIAIGFLIAAFLSRA
jgi:hypothetical protein